jgi:hypothetical protein
MDALTLEALKASIAKWERNVAAVTPDDVELGYMACPLCTLFWDDDCKGCPVAMKTGKVECDSTPYYDAYWAFNNWILLGSSSVAGEAFRSAAQDEVDFLKSLLPEGEQ